LQFLNLCLNAEKIIRKITVINFFLGLLTMNLVPQGSVVLTYVGDELHWSR